MKQKTIKANRSRTKSTTFCCITDRLSVWGELVYNFIKSLDGYEEFDLSTRQIARYFKNRGIKVGRTTILKALTELEALGVIYLEEQGGGNKTNTYQVDDEKLAVEIDFDRSWNKQRAKMWKLIPEEDYDK
jgi:DNA-binding transcriptional ArsR family regulator